MRALITGRAGFIGSHLSEGLARLEPSVEIRVLDDLSSGKEAGQAGGLAMRFKSGGFPLHRREQVAAEGIWQ